MRYRTKLCGKFSLYMYIDRTEVADMIPKRVIVVDLRAAKTNIEPELCSTLYAYAVSQSHLNAEGLRVDTVNFPFDSGL